MSKASDKRLQQAGDGAPQSVHARATKSDAEEHLRRVQRICTALPETVKKLSHGEPTFFVRKKVYAMFANNHHDDGHIAVGPRPTGNAAYAAQERAAKILPAPLCWGARLG